MTSARVHSLMGTGERSCARCLKNSQIVDLPSPVGVSFSSVACPFWKTMKVGWTLTGATRPLPIGSPICPPSRQTRRPLVLLRRLIVSAPIVSP